MDPVSCRIPSDGGADDMVERIFALRAIAIKAKALWLQDGITHSEGEALAREAGLMVVSNDCMLRRHYQHR